MQQISSAQIQNLTNCKASLQKPLLNTQNNPQALDKDTVESSTQKEKKSNKKLIGFLAGLGTAAFLVIFLIRKNRLSEAKELAEKIDFKKANSIEEAIEFGKKNLGIKKYEGFKEADLDVINWVNEGFVNTSNAMKGKLRVPKKVLYDNFEDFIAGVTPDNQYFIVNKKIFSNLDDYLNSGISKISGPKEKNSFLVRKSDRTLEVSTRIIDTKNTHKLINDIEKFECGKMTSFDEKVRLYNNLSSFHDMVSGVINAPIIKLRYILNNPKAKERILNADELLEKAEKGTFEQQQKILKSLLNHKDLDIRLQSPYSSQFKTVYHEMGHIQDMKPRVQTIYKFKSPDEYPKELSDWLNNQENMQIANSVSSYSCSGPGEFVAEVFAAKMEGRKLSPEALELYKKLEGPSIPGLI